MKTAQQAATAYGTNGSSSTATTNWASGWSTQVPTMQTNAAKQAGYWQSQVNTSEALANFTKGVKGFDVTAATAKVNGVGKSSFAAGVKAASTGKYLDFSTEWMSAVSSQVATLDRTNPRGDRAANRARQAAYDSWIDTQGGSFKQ